jgi:GNAT superfamily N-acetyltransferase
MISMQLLHVSLDDVRVAPLLASMSDEYLARYGENDEMSRAVAPEFEPPSGCFLILVDDTTTVAGGGFRRYDDQTCELKRMWTASSHRRQGHAERILEALKVRAREVGYSKVVLETGTQQPEAESLYLKMGLQRISAFGHYPDSRGFGTDL